MDVGPFFIANTQPPKLIQPGESPLHHPPPLPQSTAVLSISLGEQRRDVASTQTPPDCLRVIPAVAQHAVRAMAWSSTLSLQESYSINECECLLRVVTIRTGELDRERNIATVANQMTLTPQLGPVGGIRSRLCPPKTARTELPSTTALDQSIRPQRANQSRSMKWMRSQILRSCQSRSLRQHVMPEPQPSSRGSISQGIPLRRTNRIPVRQARSGKRGLPPLGLGGADGNIG